MLKEVMQPCDIWTLRKEHEDLSRALRTRKVHLENEKLKSDEMKTSSSAIKTMKLENRPLVKRPGLKHRMTDPSPLREFARHEDIYTHEKAAFPVRIEKESIREADVGNKVNKVYGGGHLTKNPSILLSSYDLARRRLSLPLTTSLSSSLEESWNTNVFLLNDSDDSDDISWESPTRESVDLTASLEHRRSRNMNNMDKRQKHLAWIRQAKSLSVDGSRHRTSTNKRRMSELPALSSLATRRKALPHTLSVPLGLRRKLSRAGHFPDHHIVSNSCEKAKNEMLATLKLSAWPDHTSWKHSELSRRKTSIVVGTAAMKKNEEKRMMVAHEFLETEKTYIKALETLNEVFMKPLKNSNVVPEKDIGIMFPKQLIAMKIGHERFMNELDERLNNFAWHGALGDVFTKLGNSYHVDFMKIYSEYVDNFPKAVSAINKYSRNNQKFKRFLKKCCNDQRCQRLSITAFLLTPIQRLPRYVLLLRQLAKYTDVSHPDSFHIEISLEKMIDIINVLNNSIQNSTRVVRSITLRRSTKLRRKRNLFKVKESENSSVASSRKSSDESESSEVSNSVSPTRFDVSSPTTLTIPEQTTRNEFLSSTDLNSCSRTPSPSSSMSRSSFFKVKLRGSSESKRGKRRPVSTTEVEVYHNIHHNQTTSQDHLKRSMSRDSIGSIIRLKFESLRHRTKSSEDCLNKNASLDRISDSRSILSRFRRERIPDDDSFVEVIKGSRSEGDFLEKLNDSNSKNCVKSRDHFPVSHTPSTSCDISSELRDGYSPKIHQHWTLPLRTSRGRTPLSRESSVLSSEHDHFDTDDIEKCKDSELELGIEDKNSFDKGVKRTLSERVRPWKSSLVDGQTNPKKLGKRNTLTSAVRYLFVSKTRTSSNHEPTFACHLDSSNDVRTLNSISNEKLSTLTTV